jgi:PAS domain S-box-containing protein
MSEGFSLHIPSPSAITKASFNGPDYKIPFLEALGVAIIITNTAGIIIYWNEFAEKLYGWEAREIVGADILKITVRPESRSQAKQHLAALNAGNTWSGDFDVRCKPGNPVSESSNAQRDIFSLFALGFRSCFRRVIPNRTHPNGWSHTSKR